MSSPQTKRSNQKEFQRRLQQIEVLVNAVESAADPRVRGAATELLQTLMELHGMAVERMMEIVFESGPQGLEIIDQFAQDELTSQVLLLHDLHPLDLEMRVIRTLEKIRPVVHSNGGEIELSSMAGAVVNIRLHGSFHGCGTTTSTMKALVVEAILDAAPDAVAVEIITDQDAFGRSGLVQLGRPVSQNRTRVSGG